MLSIPGRVRVFVARGPTDMRKAIDGLAAVTRDVFKEDPQSGHLFVFCNRARNRLKILYWEESGFWLFHKRLEKGCFAWPSPGDESGLLPLSSAELHAMLGGLDFRSAKKRAWYRQKKLQELKPPVALRT